MVVLTNLAVIAAPSMPQAIGLPPAYRSAALYASGGALEHIYEGNVRSLFAAEELQLEVVLVAYQIHPWTVEQISELGPIGGRNMARWTLEGPTSPMPGEPGNCTFKLEIAHSTGASPGTDWREIRPGGKYLLRSYQTRLTIVRPSTDFDFRVHRLNVSATRTLTPQQGVLSRRFFSHG